MFLLLSVITEAKDKFLFVWHPFLFQSEIKRYKRSWISSAFWPSKISLLRYRTHWEIRTFKRFSLKFGLQVLTDTKKSVYYNYR